MAIPQSVIHHRAFTAFTSSLAPLYGAELIEWSDMVTKWELDNRAECPFDLPEEGCPFLCRRASNLTVFVPDLTFSKVKHRLAQSDHDRVVSGLDLSNTEQLTPSAFLVSALEIEDCQ